jgi:hypothetical protein
MQFRSLAHIPPKSLLRIPGRRGLGSRRASVLFGPYLAPDNGGLPDGNNITDFFTSFPGAPTWFAVSDGGAGFIPWGFWQVAVYPQGHLPPGLVSSLAFRYFEESDLGSSENVAQNLVAAFRLLQSDAVAAGYHRAAEFRIAEGPVQIGSPSPAADMGQVLVSAPYGLTTLSAFYSGVILLGPSEQPLPMSQVVAGYDTPLWAALWSPGNRALLRVTETAPHRYGRYPYPYEPPYGTPFVQ